MGIEHYLARHSDKKIFELGKGFDIFAPVGGGPHSYPATREELARRLDYVTEYWQRDANMRAYLTKLGDAVWAFLQGGTGFADFEVQGDGGDQPYEWIAQGYELVASRYHRDDPAEYAAYLRKHMDFMRKLAADYGDG